MPLALLRPARTAVVLIAAVIAANCSGTPKRLNATDRKACTTQGGYEGRSAFGLPICQFAYADGGKQCSDKADCTGRCLWDPDAHPGKPALQPGDTAAGVCEVHFYTPGCFASVKSGKITTEGIVCAE
jgi:hypothetical protein